MRIKERSRPTLPGDGSRAAACRSPDGLTGCRGRSLSNERVRATPRTWRRHCRTARSRGIPRSGTRWIMEVDSLASDRVLATGNVPRHDPRWDCSHRPYSSTADGTSLARRSRRGETIGIADLRSELLADLGCRSVVRKGCSNRAAESLEPEYALRRMPAGFQPSRPSRALIRTRNISSFGLRIGQVDAALDLCEARIRA